jgi:hypothetical protein
LKWKWLAQAISWERDAAVTQAQRGQNEKTFPEQSPRIFLRLLLPGFAKCAGNWRISSVPKMQKAPLCGALDGGRTRDRTLDLSRVKGTLSR